MDRFYGCKVYFCFWCCCAAGQLWQRVLRTAKWQCVAIATILYLMSICYIGSDFVDVVNYYNGENPHGWIEETDTMAEMLTYGVNFTDGLNTLMEASYFMNLAFIPCWAGMAFITWRVRARLKRAEWHVYIRIPEENRRWCSPCCCCTLLEQMLGLIVPPNTRYHPFMILPYVDPDGPAGPAGAGGVELAAVAPVAPPVVPARPAAETDPMAGLGNIHRVGGGAVRNPTFPV